MLLHGITKDQRFSFSNQSIFITLSIYQPYVVIILNMNLMLNIHFLQKSGLNSCNNELKTEQPGRIQGVSGHIF